MAFEEYIKKRRKTMPPFINKEGIPSWLKDAYYEGYNHAFGKIYEWLRENIDDYVIPWDDGTATIDTDFFKDFKDANESKIAKGRL